MGSTRKCASVLAAALLAVGQLLATGAVHPVAAADPIRVDVCLADSGGNPLVPGTTLYKLGSTYAFSATIEPTTGCRYQTFPVGTTNVEIWTSYNNTTSPHLVQNITLVPVFRFQTSDVTVRVQDAGGTGLPGATVRFGGALGTTWWFPGTPTGASGEASGELFPGTYTFSVGLNQTSAKKTQDVGADPLVAFTTTTLTLGYSGQIAFGGATGDSSYFPASHSGELFPGTTNFRFDFSPGGPIRLPITVGGTALTRSMIVALVRNYAGTPIPGVAVAAEPGGISLGTTNASGVAYALVDGPLGTESVSLTYGPGPFTITQDQPTKSIYDFQTGRVLRGTIPAETGILVRPEGGSNSPFDGSQIELWPGTYYFTLATGPVKKCVVTGGRTLDLSTTACVTLAADAIAPVAAPNQSPAANSAGWNKTDVTVAWNWADNAGGSGIDSANCTTSSLASGEGSTITLSATCKDLAGNTGSASYTLKVDKTDPTISGSRTPAANANGWNDGDVTVSFACGDALSGLAAGSPPANTTLSGEGAGQSVTGTCADLAGNTASTTESGINIDRTAPNTSLTGPSGWSNAGVTLTLEPNDALSGVEATHFIVDGGPAQAGTSVGISTEGIHALEYWSVDVAGNIEDHHTAEVKIDTTAPTIAHELNPLANDNGWNHTDVTVTFSCDDDLSGVASCTSPQTVTTEGASQAVTGAAVDNAGNTASDPATVSVDKTVPTITAGADRPANPNDWYNDDVVVSFTCDDDLSGIASCTLPRTLSEGADQSASGTATDAAGNSADVTLSGINIDTTKPTISAAATTVPNAAGWYDGPVTIHFTCTDLGSGIPAGACPADQVLSTEGAAVASTAQTVTDTAGNASAPSNVVTVNIDTTKPTISAAATTVPNAAGWYDGPVTIHFTCTDLGSGIPAGACPADEVLSTEGAGQTVTGTVTDVAGNASDLSNAVTVSIDLTNPTVSLTGGPADGGSYLFGSVPAAPGCSASDALSGLAGSCTVSGYEAGVGSHTVTATATDLAGRASSASAVYSVQAWTESGFYQPTDMGNGVWNTVKSGSTVPLKFEVFAGSTELTDTSIMQPLLARLSACTSGTADAIELVATGGTSLRYDSTAGQFVYNWQTPKGKAGYCYVVTVTTADGSSISANFKLK